MVTEGLRLTGRPTARLAMAGVSLLAMACGTALAQEAAVVLDEVVVEGEAQGQAPATGTVGQPLAPYAGGQAASGVRLGALGNRSVFDTPFNVSGYTDKLIRDQQARSVADIALNDPSVRIDAPVFSERDAFLIRGFSVTNLDTAFDGLFYIANPRRHFLEGIERVEILKGPTALLNGGVGRVGGTINLVPKRAGEEPLARLTTTYLSDSQIWTHADLSRRFGPSGELGVRVNGSYRAGDTALDNNEIEVGVFALGVDYRGDRLRASVDVTHSDQKINAPTSLFNSASPGFNIPEAPDGSINTSNRFEYIDSPYTMASTRLEYDVFDGTTLYAAGGLSSYEEDFLTSSFNILNPDGDATSSLAIQPQKIDGITGEIGVRSEFDTGPVGHQLNLSVLQALNENHRGGFARFVLPSYPNNIYDPVYLPDGSVDTSAFPRAADRPLFADLKLTSFAVADTLSFFDERFLLTLGGRYQDIRSRGFSTVLGPTFGSQTYEYEESRFSPAVGAVFHATERLSVYGNYVEALVEGGVAPAAALNAGEVFPPFVGEQIEAGVKYDFGRFAATASVFQIKQESGFTDPVSRLFSADGEQTNQGIELTLFGELFDGVRLLGGVTFLDAELTRNASAALDGNAVPGVPEVAVNLYGEYDLFALVEGLTLTGRAIYTDSTFYDRANLQEVDSWTRFDVGARYAFEGFNGKPAEIRANIENVADENYWASSARGFLAAGAPRTFTVSASFDF